ncbi:hypothetical protein PSP6_170122 [Paraburkholderia tropica]|nr:hypothetical protein PSP6_170122 [Paraburkholderia tropica]
MPGWNGWQQRGRTAVRQGRQGGRTAVLRNIIERRNAGRARRFASQPRTRRNATAMRAARAGTRTYKKGPRHDA